MQENDDDDGHDEDNPAASPNRPAGGRGRAASQAMSSRRMRSSSPSDRDDGNDPPPANAAARQPATRRRCWLCTFANCNMAKQVSTFVSTNAGTMDPAIMADQIKKEVLREYPLAKGIGRRHILRHIREHVLIPGVRLASIVRSLITLAETLRCTLQQVDDETGDMVVDIRNTELYLKVVTQISNVYKLDGTKLLFQNGVAPPTTRPAPAEPSSSSRSRPPAAAAGS